MEIIIGNTTTQVVYTIASIVISSLATVVLWYLKKLLSTNKYVVEYNLYNDRVERVLENSIAYAESEAKKDVNKVLTKAQLANQYIDKVAPDIIAKEGDKLDLMVQRKVEQLLATK